MIEATNHMLSIKVDGDDEELVYIIKNYDDHCITLEDVSAGHTVWIGQGWIPEIIKVLNQYHETGELPQEAVK